MQIFWGNLNFAGIQRQVGNPVPSPLAKSTLADPAKPEASQRSCPVIRCLLLNMTDQNRSSILDDSVAGKQTKRQTSSACISCERGVFHKDYPHCAAAERVDFERIKTQVFPQIHAAVSIHLHKCSCRRVGVFTQIYAAVSLHIYTAAPTHLQMRRCFHLHL